MAEFNNNTYKTDEVVQEAGRDDFPQVDLRSTLERGTLPEKVVIEAGAREVMGHYYSETENRESEKFSALVSALESIEDAIKEARDPALGYVPILEAKGFDGGSNGYCQITLTFVSDLNAPFALSNQTRFQTERSSEEQAEGNVVDYYNDMVRFNGSSIEYMTPDLKSGDWTFNSDTKSCLLLDKTRASDGVEVANFDRELLRVQGHNFIMGWEAITQTLGNLPIPSDVVSLEQMKDHAVAKQS